MREREKTLIPYRFMTVKRIRFVMLEKALAMWSCSKILNGLLRVGIEPSERHVLSFVQTIFGN